MRSSIRRIIADCKGGTAIEYALIVSLIVIMMVAAFSALANTTVSMWGNVNNKVVAANNGG